jgi:hypothetical protein
MATSDLLIAHWEVAGRQAYRQGVPRNQNPSEAATEGRARDSEAERSVKRNSWWKGWDFEYRQASARLASRVRGH